MSKGAQLKNLWPFSFYFWQFAGGAFVAPFLVLYFQSLGFSGPQIGLLSGVSPLLTLVCAPVWIALADATRRHHLVLTLTLFSAGLIEFAFPYLRAFLPVLACADEDAPPGLGATWQGLFGAAFGVGAAVGGFLGGWLLSAIGARAMYVAFGLIVFIFVAAVAALHARYTVLAQSRQ